MRRSWSSLLLLSLLAAKARAETAHGFQLGIDAGVESVRDDTLVPLAFTGPKLALEPRYVGAFGEALVSAGARVGAAALAERNGNEGGWLGWGLFASYLPVLRDARVSVAVGPVIGWDNDVFLPSDWDDTHAYWIGTLWLGPGARTWCWLSDKWRLDASGEVLLVGAQSRPPAYRRNKQDRLNHFDYYLKAPTTDFDVGSIADFQLARVSLELYRARRRLAIPNGWGVGTEFAFSRASSPAPAFAFSALARASYTWSR